MSIFGDIGKNIVGSKTGRHGTEEVSKGYRRGRKSVKEYYDKAEAELRPYLDFGKLQMTAVQRLFDDPSYIRNTPGYNFRYNEGASAVENSAAAKGSLFGGNTLLELTRYGQEFATNEYDKELGRLMGGVQVGQNASQLFTNLASSTGGDIAGLHAGEGRDIGAMLYGSSRQERQQQHEVGMSFLSMTGGGGK
jgi:hypothetical protein